MKVKNSLRSLKARHRQCQVVRRKGRVFVINKHQKAIQGTPRLTRTLDADGASRPTIKRLGKIRLRLSYRFRSQPALTKASICFPGRSSLLISPRTSSSSLTVVTLPTD